MKTRPWLAALLMQKSNQLFARFVTFYARLTAVKQQTRRLAVGVGTAALLLALSSAPTPAHAAEITVGDGCTLVQAIISANTDAIAPDSSCTAGDGADTIVLAGGTYSYDTAFGELYGSVTQSALPFITSEITIEANDATIVRTDGNMRLFNVGDAGNLTLNSAIITGGEVNQRGGGILNSATLTINNSTISGNNADTGGGFESAGGTVVINNSTITGNNAPNGGGGVYIGNGATVTLNRTIVSGNTANAGAEIRIIDGTLDAENRNVLGHSGLNDAQAFSGSTPGGTSVRATSNGTNSTALSSILNTTLANNGGPTPTHALVAGSPAIDLIPTTDPDCDAGVSTDQRGAVRAGEIDPGDGRGGLACDIGAHEVLSSETPTAVTLTAFTANGGPALPGIMAVAFLLLLGVGTVWHKYVIRVNFIGSSGTQGVDKP